MACITHLFQTNNIDSLIEHAKNTCFENLDNNIVYNITLMYDNIIGTTLNSNNYFTPEEQNIADSIIQKFVSNTLNIGLRNGSCICKIVKHIYNIIIMNINPNKFLNLDNIIKSKITTIIDNYRNITQILQNLQEIFNQFNRNTVSDTLPIAMFNTIPSQNLNSILTQCTTIDSNIKKENLSCGICQDPFNDSDEIIASQCDIRHHFHKNCIKPWVTEHHNNCPLCKHKFYNDINHANNEDNIGEDNIGENNIGEDNIGEDNIGEDNIGEDNIREDNIGEDNTLVMQLFIHFNTRNNTEDENNSE